MMFGSPISEEDCPRKISRCLFTILNERYAMDFAKEFFFNHDLEVEVDYGK
jgi:hypothetical protein